MVVDHTLTIKIFFAWCNLTVWRKHDTKPHGPRWWPFLSYQTCVSCIRNQSSALIKQWLFDFPVFEWPEKNLEWILDSRRINKKPAWTQQRQQQSMGTMHGCIHGDAYLATGPTTSRSGKLRWCFSQPNVNERTNRRKTLSLNHCFSYFWMLSSLAKWAWKMWPKIIGESSEGHFISQVHWTDPAKRRKTHQRLEGMSGIPMLARYEVDNSLG